MTVWVGIVVQWPAGIDGTVDSYHYNREDELVSRCLPISSTFLEFDPWEPYDHWCVRCGHAHQGRKHDDWWAMGAQLWTAERAVHGAALFALRGDPRHAALTVRILRAYAER